MPDTDRLINKDQGDSIIAAIQGITSRLQEMYTVDDALSGTSENPVQNKVVKGALDSKVDAVTGKGLSTNDYTNEEKALVATIPNKADVDDVKGTQTVSGNPITLTDCAPINAESLVVELEPKQDLHGYDTPWVGGAGKNKLPMTVAGIKDVNTDGTWSGNVFTHNDGVTFTILTDSDGNVTGINANGTASADILFYEATYLAYDNIVYNGCPSGGSWASYCQVLIPSYTADYGDGASYNFTEESSQVAWIRIASGTNVSNKVFYPMVRLSTETDPTFATYSNICPITGYDECEVDDVGKNLLNIDAVSYPYTDSNSNVQVSKNTDGSIKLNGTATGEFLYPEYPPNQDFYKYLKPSTNYIASIGITTSDITIQVYYRETSASQWTLLSEAQGSLQFTTPSVWYDIWVRYMAANGTSFSNLTIYPMVRLATDADSNFEPYKSSNATIQFGQTVYGGSVGFLTGILTVTGRCETFDGSSDEPWAVTNNEFYIQDISGYDLGNIAGSTLIANEYKGVTVTSWTQLNNGDIAFHPTAANYVRLKDTRYSNVNDFKTFLASNPLQICYELATPFTIQLTPDELKLLKGTNNLSTNGTTINLGYQPDNVIGELKGEIEKCSPNPEFMHFEVNGNVVDAIPIIFDEAIHSYTVSGDNWKDKTFLCVECCDMRYGILQLVLSSDMAFVDSCGKALMLYPYMRSIEQYIKITISLGQSYGYEISYQTTSTSSLLDYLKIRVRLFN